MLAFGLPFFFVAHEAIAIAIVLTVIAFSLAVRACSAERVDAAARRSAAAQGPDYVASADYRAICADAPASRPRILRPAGVASIDGQRVDVLTEGDFVPAGTPIRVTRVEGARIFVEPISMRS